MSFLSMLGSVFGFADTALSYLSEKQRMNYRDKLFILKKFIIDEEMKPMSDQDDVKLEKAYSQLPLLLESINVQMQIEIASKR